MAIEDPLMTTSIDGISTMREVSTIKCLVLGAANGIAVPTLNSSTSQTITRLAGNGALKKLQLCDVRTKKI